MSRRRPVPMHYDTLLLDLDHTLLDSDASQDAAFAHAFAAAGVDDPSRYRGAFDEINVALWRAVERGELLPGDVRARRFERLLAITSLDADPVLLADEYVTGLGRFGELFDGAREMLDRLAGRARLALVTNGIGEVQRARIERLAVARYFDAIVVSGEVGTAKPGAAIFDLTFERLGEPDRRSSLMTGDSLSSDVAGGINAGIATCWYNPTGRRPNHPATTDHEIAELAQLPGLAEVGVVG